MTDTTEQQAVTVAQEDREAAADLFCIVFPTDKSIGTAMRRPIGDGGPWVQAFARHRLASVSSASAETGAVDRAVWCAREAEARRAEDNSSPHTAKLTREGRYDDQGVMPVAIEAARIALNLAASPEPVPATNQAGEVDVRVRLREAYDAVADWPEKRGDPMTVGAAGFMDLLKLRNLVAELLDATQPAMSQEEEAVDHIAKAIYEAGGSFTDQNGFIAWDDLIGSNDAENFRKMASAALAATPTPPTLSEDLREAAQAVVDDYPVAAGMYPSLEGTDGKPGYGSIRRLAAALAQVKAS